MFAPLRPARTAALIAALSSGTLCASASVTFAVGDRPIARVDGNKKIGVCPYFAAAAFRSFSCRSMTTPVAARQHRGKHANDRNDLARCGGSVNVDGLRAGAGNT